MKTSTAVAVMSAVAMLSVTSVAFAQANRSMTPKQTPAAERTTWRGQEGVVESTKIIGTKVRTSAGKDVGEVDYLLVDSRSGKVTHAVIGLGGMLGVGETKIVVPWSSVTLAHDANNRDKMVVTMEQSAVDSAPRYDRKEAATDRAPAASPRAPK
jgi:sporulation protein YlmC with PRC-barrel domain